MVISYYQERFNEELSKLKYNRKTSATGNFLFTTPLIMVTWQATRADKDSQIALKIVKEYFDNTCKKSYWLYYDSGVVPTSKLPLTVNMTFGCTLQWYHMSKYCSFKRMLEDSNMHNLTLWHAIESFRFYLHCLLIKMRTILLSLDSFLSTLPSLIVGGLIKRGFKSSPEIGILGCGNELK